MSGCTKLKQAHPRMISKQSRPTWCGFSSPCDSRAVCGAVVSPRNPGKESYKILEAGCSVPLPSDDDKPAGVSTRIRPKHGNVGKSQCCGNEQAALDCVRDGLTFPNVANSHPAIRYNGAVPEIGTEEEIIMQRESVIAAAILSSGLGVLAMSGEAAEQASKMTVLTDGTKMDNFDQAGNASWRIAERAIAADRGNGFLVTKDSYGDFKLRAEFYAD